MQLHRAAEARCNEEAMQSEDYNEAYATARLSAQRILDFVSQRRQFIEHLSLRLADGMYILDNGKSRLSACAVAPSVVPRVE